MGEKHLAGFEGIGGGPSGCWSPFPKSVSLRRIENRATKPDIVLSGTEMHYREKDVESGDLKFPLEVWWQDIFDDVSRVPLILIALEASLGSCSPDHRYSFSLLRPILSVQALPKHIRSPPYASTLRFTYLGWYPNV